MNNLDMNFLKPFVDGTVYTVDVQFRCQASYGKPFLKKPGAEQPTVDIAGIISIFSSSFTGTIRICFPEQTFLNFMEKMLGEKYPVINEEVADGAGEMMNIIFGFAKRVLNDSGHDLEKAIPSVIYGNNIRLAQRTEDPVIVLPFTSELGQFHLEISIDQKGASRV